jgi:hypothetical protein
MSHQLPRGGTDLMGRRLLTDDPAATADGTDLVACVLPCNLLNQRIRLFFALEFVFAFFTVRDLIAGFVGWFVA